MGKSVRPLDNASGVKAQNAEWFAADIVISDTGKIRMNVAVNSAVDVEITKDYIYVWMGSSEGGILYDSNSFFDDNFAIGENKYSGDDVDFVLIKIKLNFQKNLKFYGVSLK